MLVISRRLNESIKFPNLGITVTLLKNTGSKIRLGIDAPREVPIIREELEDQPPRLSYLMDDRVGRETPLGREIRSANASLRALSSAIESTRWHESERLISKLFGELRTLDDQVSEMAQRVRPRERKERRALVVDDNKNESELLASYLRLKRFHVDVAHDGARAIESLDASGGTDVVLLDMKMPKYDGPWTIDALRTNPKHKHLKVFAVSGGTPEDYGVEVGARGVDRWLKNPVNPEELIEAMNDATKSDSEYRERCLAIE